MKSIPLTQAALFLSLFCAMPVFGQLPTASTAEFITSSSPLPDGTIVTTTFFPKLGKTAETRLTGGNNPVVASPFGIASKPSFEPSTLGTPAQVSPPAYQIPAAQTALLPPTTVPVYPALTQPVVTVPTWGNPFTGPRRYLPPNYQPEGYNLGMPQVSAGYLPTGTIYPYPVASTAPTLGNAPVIPPPPPYTGPAQANFQPVFRLQNLPPGTHVGQGIIGQPTAYVDGQPFRNLLRYIFP